MAKFKSMVTGTRGLRWVRRIFAVGSGAVLAVAFPGIDIGVGLWFWLPLLLACFEIGGRSWAWRNFRTGWLAGVTFHLITLRWLSDIWSAGPVLSLLGWFLLSSYLAMYFGVWSALVGWLARTDWQLLEPEEKKKFSGVTVAPVEGGKPTLESWSEHVEARKRPAMPKWLRGSLMVLGNAAIAAAAWVALEWVRGWLMTGFGWNGLAVGMHQNATLIQAADLVGVTGLSFVPVFCGYVLYVTLRRVHLEISRGRWRPHPEVGVAVLLVVACFVYGVRRLSEKPEVMSMQVAAVQPLMSQDQKHDRRAATDNAISIVGLLRDEMIAREVEMTQVLEAAILSGEEVELQSPHLDLVVLPESVVPWVIQDPHSYEFARQVRLVSAGASSDVVMGLMGQKIDAEDPEEYNSVAAFLNGRDYADEYHKMRLVPFGEYLPLRWIPPIEWIAGRAVPGDFDRGTSTEPLDLLLRNGEPSADMIPLLCFEDTIGEHARQFVREGRPQLMVNVTNDGWFAGQLAGRQHAANAMFRCIELRRPMVRAANTGMTCIIDSTGSFYDRHRDDRSKPQVLLDASGETTQVEGVLFGNAYLPVSGEMTLYAWAGDWFAMVCAGSVGLVILGRGVGALRNRGADEGEE
ncbi:apolipoprotein N-acyltransferase [Sulfuriroseicoccus oceanibius]|uniref:Apolipoprotein N-acyltransferase n=1 Tax=Sulfuriroseicoccus oceanibius TaxID=2707525 RepID=A0A6B3LA66_9BACT|nr:apolipoprotein N-acyltransferase [Sulfuriroseicoccus oceanibius]QQL44191.1 apolipoprotein N-acyltransferase [Sulfuriroseicoccus oceanibius]